MDVDIVNTFSESVFIASQRKMTILVRAWDKYDSIMKVSPDLTSQEVEIGKINPKKWDNFVVKIDGKMYHRLYNNRNGSVESQNKKIIACLQKHVGDKKNFWEPYLITAVLEYNCTINSTTGETPYFLVFG